MATRTHITPQSALARIVEGADAIGPSVSGGTFLLVDVRPELLDYLSVYGADAEDLEDDDPDQEDDPPEDDARRFPVDARPTWPPSREELTTAFEAGGTCRSVARIYGKGSTAVFKLAQRLGIKLGPPRRRAKPKASQMAKRPKEQATIPADLVAPQPWPASAEVMRRLIAAGIGDSRAAALFGVHPETYRRRRREVVGISVMNSDGEAPNPADYGYVRGARWPRWAKFSDCPEAKAAGRSGRLYAPPATFVPTASAMAE